jgi:hypothetical protein
MYLEYGGGSAFAQKKARHAFPLKDCVRKLRKASGLGTPEGMAQVSCIYEFECVLWPHFYHNSNMNLTHRSKSTSTQPAFYAKR